MNYYRLFRANAITALIMTVAMALNLFVIFYGVFKNGDPVTSLLSILKYITLILQIISIYCFTRAALTYFKLSQMSIQ